MFVRKYDFFFCHSKITFVKGIILYVGDILWQSIRTQASTNDSTDTQLHTLESYLFGHQVRARGNTLEQETVIFRKTDLSCFYLRLPSLLLFITFLYKKATNRLIRMIHKCDKFTPSRSCVSLILHIIVDTFASHIQQRSQLIQLSSTITILDIFIELFL